MPRVRQGQASTANHHSGLFSLFSTASSSSASAFGSGAGSSASSWDQHSPSAHLAPQANTGVLQQQQQRSRLANEQQLVRPARSLRMASGRRDLKQSPSQPSLSSLRQELPQLPSSSSVPTGMAGDKMLFSPLDRQYRQSKHRANLSIESTPEPTDTPPTSFQHQRRRVHSAPRYLHRHAAQSMCELLVFPKPPLAPHLLTPPSSPDETPAGVVEQGMRRDRERDDMARRSRSRSIGRGTRRLSFGEEKPVKGAPLVGSAVARREEAVRRERRRSRSLERKERFHSLSRGFGLGHARSTDNLQQSASGHSRNRSTTDVGDRSDLSLAVDVASSRGSRTHQHSRSDPDLLSHPRGKSQPLKVRMRAPNDIVIIGPESPPRIDFSKPLPPLPNGHASDADAFPMPPHRQNVGIALTIDQPALSPATPGYDSMTSMSRYSGITAATQQSTTASARAELDRQHRRDQTRRAFAAPAGPGQRGSIKTFPMPTSDTPASTRQQSGSDRTRTTDSSDMHSSDLTFPGVIPANRRLTALEQAIGRSRTASLGSSDTSHQHSLSRSTSIKTSATSKSASGTSSSGKSKATITPTRPPRPPSPVATIPAPLSPTHALAPALAHPISPRSSSLPFNREASGRATTVPSMQAAVSRPSIPHLDTSASAASGRTVYSDASEGWNTAPVVDAQLKPPRPPISHIDTNASAASGRTVYTDASEGWSREDTYTPPNPVPISVVEIGPHLQVSRSESVSTDAEDDFRGLFFRTPKDAAYEHSPLAASPMPSRERGSQSSPAAFPRLSDESVGLGYDLHPVSASAPAPSLRATSSAKSADYSMISTSETNDPARRLSYGEGTDSDSGIVVTPNTHQAGVDEEQISFAGAQLRGKPQH